MSASPNTQPNNEGGQDGWGTEPGSLTAYVKGLEAEAADNDLPTEFEELISVVHANSIPRGEYTAAVMEMLTVLLALDGSEDESELMDIVFNYESYDIPVLLRVTLGIALNAISLCARNMGTPTDVMVQRIAWDLAAKRANIQGDE